LKQPGINVLFWPFKVRITPRLVYNMTAFKMRR